MPFPVPFPRLMYLVLCCSGSWAFVKLLLLFVSQAPCFLHTAGSLLSTAAVQVCCPARDSPLSAAAAVDNSEMVTISQRRVQMRNDFKVR